MDYKILIEQRPQKILIRLKDSVYKMVAETIADHILELEKDPFNPKSPEVHIKHVHESVPRYRMRIGEYVSVLFRVEDNIIIIEDIRIARKA
ncbi:MAG: hypothetical protein MUO26_05060 [Methanotrichaceae archaeon]|nr:hypothetical protein [Methanotrichaceae archaeon]